MIHNQDSCRDPGLLQRLVSGDAHRAQQTGGDTNVPALGSGGTEFPGGIKVLALGYESPQYLSDTSSLEEEKWTGENRLKTDWLEERVETRDTLGQSHGRARKGTLTTASNPAPGAPQPHSRDTDALSQGRSSCPGLTGQMDCLCYWRTTLCTGQNSPRRQ
ncbi:unnamed protein product [Gadus morhua 'NCC']